MLRFCVVFQFLKKMAFWRHTRPWSACSGRADARMDEPPTNRWEDGQAGGVASSGELAATGVACGAVLRLGGWFAPGLIHPSAESFHWWGAWWLELVWILLINAGVGGCCCQLGVLTCSGPERLINKLSLIFCSIRNDGVQLDLMRRCCWFVVLVMITLMVHRCLMTPVNAGFIWFKQTSD